MFRAHGLLLPVLGRPGEPEGARTGGPAADFAKRYNDTLADKTPLEAAAAAKQAGRPQLTLR